MNDLQITYFLALCRYKNFSETARRLYVSQPAVSKQIFSLEEELGVTLFKREYKNIDLTKEGKILQETLEKTVQMIQDAKTRMYRQSHSQEYSLKIGVLQGLDIADLLPCRCRRFPQRPQIRRHLRRSSLHQGRGHFFRCRWESDRIRRASVYDQRKHAPSQSVVHRTGI